MYTIKLYVTAEGWMSQHANPEIIKLFGTDTIPTAFTRNAPATKVLQEIRKLNPDSRVIVCS